MVINKQNNLGRIKVLFLLTCLLTGLGSAFSSAFAANLSATVDRNPVNLDESFQLTLTVEGGTDGNPELDVLKNDFEILSQNQSSNLQIINGSMSRQSHWVITLMAKKTGNVILPAISIGNNRSQPIKMTIKKALPSGMASTDLFLEVSSDRKEAYTQAQLIYTVRLYTAVNLGSASLSEPKTSGMETIIEKLGDDSEFATQRNGKSYRAIERSYAIFPQQSGTLKLQPILFNGQIIQSRSRFSNNPFSQSTRSKRIRSKSLSINIKAAPTTQSQQSWLPARNIQLTESWQENPPRFIAGEAVTRTLTLAADGLLAEQLPEIKISMPAGLKHYADQAIVNDQKKSTGIIAMRQQKIAIIPSQTGQYTLPEIKLDWWNTKTNSKETLRIPPRTIQVTASDASSQASPKLQTPLNTEHTASTPNNDSNFDTLIDKKNKLFKTLHASYWPWLSLALALGWLSTFIIMRSQKKQLSPYLEAKKSQQSENTLSEKMATKKLEQACLSNDPAYCKEALLSWAKIYFTHQPSTSLADLSAHTNNAVGAELEKLNQVLYSQTETNWEGQALWREIKHYRQSNKSKSKKEKQTLLSPLHP